MTQQTWKILMTILLATTTLFWLWLYEKTHSQSIVQASPYVINSVSVPWIDTTYPTRATPNLDESITDLDYRIKTLPYDQDKSAAWYVVYPKLGVTTPLVRPKDWDVKKIQVGEMFDHYKYLEEWALHYVWDAPDQWIGNMVLAVHSSFANTDPGRYKTAGQVAPLSNIGDKVFVYLADITGKYTLYIYTIKRSEQIPETAVDILKQDVTEKSLTLFTCYPIGTTDARRVNQAELTTTLSESEWSKNWWNAEKTHQAAPVKNEAIVKEEQTTKNKEIAVKKETKTKKAVNSENTKKSASFTTQSTTNDKSSKTIKSQSIKPTFKERVTYRPAVYNTAMKLVKTVWFKRTNLQKVIELIDIKIAWFEKDLEIDPNAKKRIVLFMLIQEIVEGFMQ
jgi:sortase (surface protein transpeptidase)